MISLIMISSFREGYIFTKLRICEVSRKYNPRENFRIYSMCSVSLEHGVVGWSAVCDCGSS